MLWRVLESASPSISHLVQIINWRQSSLSKLGDKKHKAPQSLLKERLAFRSGCCDLVLVLFSETGKLLYLSLMHLYKQCCHGHFCMCAHIMNQKKKQ